MLPTTATSDTLHAGPDRWVPLKRLAVWGAFFGVLYLGRDFFFVAFTTFLFSYLTLTVVDRVMARFSPGRERAWLRRVATLAFFAIVPLGLLAAFLVIAPPLLAQGQRLVGWLSHTSPQAEVIRVLEGFVGPYEFAQDYGNANDPRYRKGLEEFAATGERHVSAYQSFPALETWVEGGVGRPLHDAEAARVRIQLARQGTSSHGFTQWFLTTKAPELKAAAAADKHPGSNGPLGPLIAAAGTIPPEELLLQARHDPGVLNALAREWMADTLVKDLGEAKRSLAYQKRFQDSYEALRQRAPAAVSYSFEEYEALRKARTQGPGAFADAMDRLRPTAAEDRDKQLQHDFESAKQHELFQEWWATSSTGKFLRSQIDTALSGMGGGAHIEGILTTLLNVPFDLGTALLLSLFICIDHPRLRSALGQLRETWLREVHEEIAPALERLGTLIARAMFAQGLIALCNALLLFAALSLLGVEHEVFLSLAVFVLCMVPTLGAVLAWAMIATFALLQPGGGVLLALKASGAVLGVMLLETFVLSPRILGKMMELHPVVIIALLPVAQYFFGVWGLILATPIAVYVVYVVILQQELPGIDRTGGDGPHPEKP